MFYLANFTKNDAIKVYIFIKGQIKESKLENSEGHFGSRAKITTSDQGCCGNDKYDLPNTYADISRRLVKRYVIKAQVIIWRVTCV